MIAKLVKENNNYYCSKCRMKQPKIIESYCFFCSTTFSNYEEELTKIFKENEDNKIEKIK